MQFQNYKWAKYYRLRYRPILVAGFVVSFILLASCNGNSKKAETQSDVKGKWAQSTRQEYMKNCISSARQSYAQRGQQGDSATIVTLCKCAGEMIEQKYSPEDAEKISNEEGKAIMMEAAKKCLPKQ